MDKTLAVLLSGFGEVNLPMVVDLVGLTAQAFQNIDADNPLCRLSESIGNSSTQCSRFILR